MNFSLKIGRSTRLLNLGFSAPQMRIVAEAAARAEEDRWRRGQNVHDLAAKPLSARYARRKQRKGGSPIRDMRLTGALITAHQPTRITENYAVVDFSSAQQSEKAWINQEIEEMVGLSPADKILVSQVIDELHQVNVKKMKVRK